jgi:type I restriction enzyme S subunit
MDRAVRPEDEVITCFRDGIVTLRRNRRLGGYTEALQETGYQGIRRGDLVIHGMDAFAGAVGVSDSDGKGTPVYSVCRPVDGVSANYYAYVVREMARSEWIMALARGIRERSTDFRFEAFGTQYLPIPPSDEQHLIARYLAWLEAEVNRLIAAKQRLRLLLSEQREAFVRSAITRGLDANGSIKTGHVPGPEQMPGQWQAVPLKRVLRRLIDCEHKTAPYVPDSEWHVVRTSAVKNGRLVLDGTYATTAEGYEEWTRRGVPEAGDVIFTREAPAGEACVVPEGLNLCLGQRTVLMRVRAEEYDPRFLVHMIYAGPPRDRIRIASQGSTVGHFNMDDIGRMTVLKPPLREQEKIVERLSAETKKVDQALERCDAELSLIREYRSRIVADVVSGTVDVRAVADALGSVSEQMVASRALDLEVATIPDDAVAGDPVVGVDG